MSLMTKINETKAYLQTKGVELPEFGLILGSGLGELAEEIEAKIVALIKGEPITKAILLKW